MQKRLPETTIYVYIYLYSPRRQQVHTTQKQQNDNRSNRQVHNDTRSSVIAVIADRTARSSTIGRDVANFAITMNSVKIDITH